jgi:large subunit ribosomal protein L6
MSRIGERKLVIPAGVTVNVDGSNVTVKGPKGELSLNVDKLVKVEVDGEVLKTLKVKPTKEANMMQGTTNSLLNNMLTGVSAGFDKTLEAVGVGYRFQVSGNKITVSAGYSHPVIVEVPNGMTVTSDVNTEITIHGIDKQKVTEFAANIRKIREPEPYKGKGIRYKDEHIRRKEGKKAA